MKVITCTSGKGGSSKSSNCVELAAALKIYGKRVLVIDVDQTCSLTDSVGAYYDPSEREEYGIKTIHDVLMGECTVDEAIMETEGFDLIVSDERLIKAETTFNQPDNQYLLLDLCEMFADQYDYIFIDHGPQKDIVQKMVLVASDMFLISTMIDEESRKAARTSVVDIQALQNTRNHEVHGEVIGFIISNAVRGNLTELAQDDMLEESNKYAETHKIVPKVFTVPTAIAINEAKTFKMPNVVKHKSTKVSRCYFDIAEYIMEMEDKLNG